MFKKGRSTVRCETTIMNTVNIIQQIFQRWKDIDILLTIQRKKMEKVK